MSSYKQYVKSKSIEYKNISIKKEIDINNFMNNFLMIEKMGQRELINFAYDEKKIRQDDYYWFMYNQKILENKIIEEGGYTTLFLTLTLPSSFHKFSKKTQRYNPNYDEKDTIENGYKRLNDTFRSIYKDFKVNRKFVKIYYSKIFEPHSNFTPHLHSILYVKSEFKDNLIQHIKNQIEKNQLGESFEIKEIKEEKSMGYATTYLLKYVRKNTKVEDEEKFRIFNGWKKAHKIRVFTCSILNGLERFLYKKIKNNTTITRDLKENPIAKILNECNINIVTTCKTTKQVKTKTNAVENPKFTINVKKERTQIKDKKELELVKNYVEMLKNDFWKCAKNNDFDNSLINTGKFDFFTLDFFVDNKRFLDTINKFYVKNFIEDFNFRTFFKDLEFTLHNCVKNVHTYRVVDLKIFEHISLTLVKKYDKEEYLVTNLTKKENRLKRFVWEIKENKKYSNKL